MATTPGVGATYKAREVEETLDIWFYRPLGYQIARAAWRLGLTPNAVTAMGALLGILAGHLFLYRGWVPAAWGIALLVTSEAFDSADGQLARLSGQYSKLGRILDGLAGKHIAEPHLRRIRKYILDGSIFDALLHRFPPVGIQEIGMEFQEALPYSRIRQ